MQLNEDTPLDQAVPRNSKFLSKDDVGAGVTVTISHMTLEDVEGDDGKIDRRAVLNFHGDIKPLILNQTNKELLKAVTGATTVGGVKGKTITVYSDPTIMFGGRAVGGLRIKQADPAQPTF